MPSASFVLRQRQFRGGQCYGAPLLGVSWWKMIYTWWIYEESSQLSSLRKTCPLGEKNNKLFVMFGDIPLLGQIWSVYMYPSHLASHVFR